MAKRNSSGSERPRRGSTGRTGNSKRTSSGSKGFSSSRSRDDSKGDRDSTPGKRSSSRSSFGDKDSKGKSSSRDGGSFRGKSSGSSKEGGYSSRGKSSFGDKPFGDKREGSSRGKSSFGDKPFGDKRKSRGGKSYGDSDSSKERSSSRGKSSFGDKPYGDKRESRGGKSYGDSDTSKERSSSRGKSSFGDKPYGAKRESRDGKSFGDSDSSKERYSSRGKSSFGDKPFGAKRESRGGKSFGDSDSSKERYSSRGKSSFGDKPYGDKRESRGGKNFGDSDSFKEKYSSDDKRPARSGFGKKSDGEFEKRPPRKSFSEGDKADRFSSKGEGYSSPKKFGRDDDRGKSFDRKKTSSSREVPRKRTSSTREPRETEAPVQTGLIRLNRYIANSGVCSRREADNLITMGLVSVNGKTITELGFKVNPGDEVRYENKVLRAEKPVYILMNKPKGFLTTTSDPQERNTVMNILANSVRERVYPVGRLDRNTTGLLLLTNDGDLADKLMHPSYNVKKIYKVELDRPITRNDFLQLQEGVKLEEGVAKVDDAAIVSEDSKTIGIEIHIGWNRVIRRIFEALGYDVVKLDRSVYAGLDKKDLPRGHWRHLKQEEIVRLKHYK